MSIVPPREMAEQLQRRLNRLSPGHPALLLPFDAFLCDILEDTIADVERAKADKQPKQDELTAKQQDKAQQIKQRIHERWMEWRDARNQCRKIANSKAQQIMRLLPADWDSEPIKPISLSVSDALIFTSYEQGKQECDRLELQLWQLESQVSAMNAALAFENEDRGQQAKRLVSVLADDFMDLVSRVQRLEEASRETKPRKKVA